MPYLCLFQFLTHCYLWLQAILNPRVLCVPRKKSLGKSASLIGQSRKGILYLTHIFRFSRTVNQKNNIWQVEYVTETFVTMHEAINVLLLLLHRARKKSVEIGSGSVGYPNGIYTQKQAHANFLIDSILTIINLERVQ